MSTRSGPRELAEAVGTAARELAGKVRRMIVTRTRTALWQVTGHTLLDGTTETRDAENFAGGVGYYARPNDDEDVEAIVAFPGGPGNPIIIATRQEATRRVIAADLSADETQLHNSSTLIRIKSDGTVEIRSAAGVAQSTILGEAYRSAEDTLDAAMVTLLAALLTFAGTCTTVPAGTSAALGTAIGVYGDALAAFQLASSTYLSTVAKVQ
jgi:hypothetical protein